MCPCSSAGLCQMLLWHLPRCENIHEKFKTPKTEHRVAQAWQSRRLAVLVVQKRLPPRGHTQFGGFGPQNCYLLLEGQSFALSSLWQSLLLRLLSNQSQSPKAGKFIYDTNYFRDLFFNMLLHKSCHLLLLSRSDKIRQLVLFKYVGLVSPPLYPAASLLSAPRCRGRAAG